jgi:hypothetical protein
VYFENRSTTVRMTDLPPFFGNPSIKSIAISLHTSLGIGRGWRRPTGCMCSVLFFWHMVQLRTKSQTFVVHAIGVQVRGLVSQSPPSERSHMPYSTNKGKRRPEVPSGVPRFKLHNHSRTNPFSNRTVWQEQPHGQRLGRHHQTELQCHQAKP